MKSSDRLMGFLKSEKAKSEQQLQVINKRLSEIQVLREKIESAENDEQLDEATKDIDLPSIKKEIDELMQKQTETNSRIDELDTQLENLLTELKTLEGEETKEEVKEETQSETQTQTERKEVKNMDKRNLIEIENVRNFMNAVKDIAENRATNLKVAVPTEILDVIVEKINADEILKRLDVRQLKGIGRLYIVKGVNEAVWVERGGKIGSKDAGVVYLELDAYKLAGLLELFNEDLADVDNRVLDGVINSLSNSLILTLRKTVFYGTGDKSPVGVAKRLVAEAGGTVHRDSLGAFENVKATNVLAVKLAGKGADYVELVKALGVSKIKTGLTGERTHFMNDATFLKIKTLLLEHAEGHSAVLMTGDNVLPVIGGEVVTVPEIKDDEIVSGYFNQYVLGMRQGVELAKSEEFKFDEYKTVFRAVARFDGTPVDPKAFVYLKLGATAPTAE